MAKIVVQRDDAAAGAPELEPGDGSRSRNLLSKPSAGRDDVTTRGSRAVTHEVIGPRETAEVDSVQSTGTGACSIGSDLVRGDLCRDAESGRLTALVQEHGVVTVEGLAWSNPQTSLLQVASLLGAPVSSRCGPVLELSNSMAVPQEQRNKAAEWHQDDIHTSQPCRFTLLYGVEAPAEPPATLFADLRRAFDALPDGMRRRVKDLHVRHDPVGGRVRTAGEVTGRFGHEAGPEVRHPLVLVHPSTGRRQLFGVAGTASGVVGLKDDLGVPLLRTLKDWVVAPRFVRSKTVASGTLLIWDNLALLHSATPIRYSDDECYRRRVLRVTVV